MKQLNIRQTTNLLKKKRNIPAFSGISFPLWLLYFNITYLDSNEMPILERILRRPAFTAWNAGKNEND